MPSRLPRRPSLLLRICLVAAFLPMAVSAQRESREEAQPAGALLVEPRTPGGHSRGVRAGHSRDVAIIVQLEDESLATRLGRLGSQNRRGWLRSVEARNYLAVLRGKQEGFQRAALAAAPQARIGHRLSVVLNAVSLVVPEHAVGAIARVSGVKAILADSKQQVQTVSSPGFIGAPTLWNQAGGQAAAGEGVIVGLIDTGVWPEHPSFSDPDGSGRPYAAPAGWNGAPCEFGSARPNDAPFACNNKLLGARRVMATYDAMETLLGGEFASARDDNGHGTHVATVAAGNSGVSASIVGNPLGTASGVAPRAQVAAYKVCGSDGCYDSDSAAAVQQAILDGVDVLNVALGGGANPYSDAVSLALLDAYNAGIFVAAAAGNDGLGALGRVDPWSMTAAATSINRAYQSTVTLRAGARSLTLTGAAVTLGLTTTAIVNAADFGDPYCAQSAPAGTFAGRVVVCLRGGNSRTDKSFNVQGRGAVGMVLINPSVAGVAVDSHFLPTVHLEKAASDSLLAFLTANTGESVSFTRGTAAVTTGDVLASFTSRGRASQSLGIIKPDVAAPGVQVIGGMTPLPASRYLGASGQNFIALDGTSMSSAHLAGAGALLKAANPQWSPGHIRSALMMTANGAMKAEDGVSTAGTFNVATGRIQLAPAARPGLAITTPGSEFVDLRSRLWDANYPSIYLPVMPGVMTVRRTLENLDSETKTWTVQGLPTTDVSITTPSSIVLPPFGKVTIDITINAATAIINHVRQTSVIFREVNGTRVLRLPIALVRLEGRLPVLTTCSPTTIKQGTSTSCTMSVSNTEPEPAFVTAYDTLPNALTLISSSVSEGAVSGSNTVAWQGTLAAATPGTVGIRPAPMNEGYGTLAGYYAAIPCSGSCDDQVFTGTVPQGILFNGVVYTQVSFSTNGLLRLGGDATASPVNLRLPAAEAPQNRLAPFWTDLHPAGTDGLGSGKLYAGLISLPSGRAWLVVEWADVVEKGGTARYSFEVWLQVGGSVQEITYTYSKLGGLGAGGFATVGAENATGTSGETYYYDGAGTLPSAGVWGDLLVTSPQSAPGGSRTITFRATGASAGTWTHCGVLVRGGNSEIGVSCVPVTVVR
jgi:subtilisin family serine protease